MACGQRPAGAWRCPARQPRHSVSSQESALAATIPLMIQTGAQAPDFELPDQDGNPVRLRDLRGGKVVLYFYPKADTPGCTVQACGVRDHLPDYTKAGVTVLGVSPDPVKRVKKFHDGQ